MERIGSNLKKKLEGQSYDPNSPYEEEIDYNYHNYSYGHVTSEGDTFTLVISPGDSATDFTARWADTPNTLQYKQGNDWYSCDTQTKAHHCTMAEAIYHALYDGYTEEQLKKFFSDNKTGYQHFNKIIVKGSPNQYSPEHEVNKVHKWLYKKNEPEKEKDITAPSSEDLMKQVKLSQNNSFIVSDQVKSFLNGNPSFGEWIMSSVKYPEYIDSFIDMNHNSSEMVSRYNQFIEEQRNTTEDKTVQIPFNQFAEIAKEVGKEILQIPVISAMIKKYLTADDKANEIFQHVDEIDKITISILDKYAADQAFVSPVEDHPRGTIEAGSEVKVQNPDGKELNLIVSKVIESGVFGYISDIAYSSDNTEKFYPWNNIVGPGSEWRNEYNMKYEDRNETNMPQMKGSPYISPTASILDKYAQAPAPAGGGAMGAPMGEGAGASGSYDVMSGGTCDKCPNSPGSVTNKDFPNPRKKKKKHKANVATLYQTFLSYFGNAKKMIENPQQYPQLYEALKQQFGSDEAAKEAITKMAGAFQLAQELEQNKTPMYDIKGGEPAENTSLTPNLTGPKTEHTYTPMKSKRGQADPLGVHVDEGKYTPVYFAQMDNFSPEEYVIKKLDYDPKTQDFNSTKLDILLYNAITVGEVMKNQGLGNFELFPTTSPSFGNDMFYFAKVYAGELYYLSINPITNGGCSVYVSKENRNNSNNSTSDSTQKITQLQEWLFDHSSEPNSPEFKQKKQELEQLKGKSVILSKKKSLLDRYVKSQMTFEDALENWVTPKQALNEIKDHGLRAFITQYEPIVIIEVDDGSEQWKTLNLTPNEHGDVNGGEILHWLGY